MKQKLGRTIIYAPQTGRYQWIRRKSFENAADDWYRILRVANLNNMEVDVNENDIVKIKVGDLANVEVDLS
jgi:HlyD family secretion protein